MYYYSNGSHFCRNTAGFYGHSCSMDCHCDTCHHVNESCVGSLQCHDGFRMKNSFCTRKNIFYELFTWIIKLRLQFLFCFSYYFIFYSYHYLFFKQELYGCFYQVFSIFFSCFTVLSSYLSVLLFACACCVHQLLYSFICWLNLSRLSPAFWVL